MKKLISLTAAFLCLSVVLQAQVTSINFEQLPVGSGIAPLNAITQPIGLTFDGAFPASLTVISDLSSGSSRALRAQTLTSKIDILINLAQPASRIRVRFPSNAAGALIPVSLTLYSANRTPAQQGGPQAIKGIVGTEPNTLELCADGILAVQLESSSQFVIVDDIEVDWSAAPAASSSPFNGSGTNPTGFAETAPAMLGSSWQASVQLASNEVASLMSLGTQGVSTGPVVQGPLVFGEVLCAPPYAFIDFAQGSHSVAIPDQCALLGLTFCAQAATLNSSLTTIQLRNAIAVTIGTH